MRLMLHCFLSVNRKAAYQLLKTATRNNSDVL